MEYTLTKANINNTNKLIEYKLDTIFKYAENLSFEEINEIKKYVKENVPRQLKDYKMIIVDDKEIGCLLVYNKDDGILLDEIYIEDEYRNKGIGSKIIKQLLLENNIVYLWVYKLNTKAISLYKNLGFNIIEQTESRYYMKYKNLTK